jgi:hypothetical protein
LPNNCFASKVLGKDGLMVEKRKKMELKDIEMEYD